MFTFSKHLHCVFISGSPHVPLRAEGTHFSTIPSAFIVCSIFADGHSAWCELIGFCKLGWHVFENSQNLSFFQAFFYSGIKTKCEYNIPLEIILLKDCPLFNILGNFGPQGIFWKAGVIYRPAMCVNI